MTTKLFEKNRAGGFLVVVRIQLTFDLEIAGGKKSSVFKKHRVPVGGCTWQQFHSFCLVWSLGRPERCAVFSIRHRWHRSLPSCCTMAQGWGCTSVDCRWSAHPSAPRCGLRGSSCGHTCGGWRRPCVQWTSPWRCLRWVRCTASWCQCPPQCSCRQGWWSCTSRPAGRVATYSCSPWSPCG